jgi:hypothetical protein
MELPTMFDMKNLTRLKKLDENAPDTMKAFWAFDKEAFKDGAIDVLHYAMPILHRVACKSSPSSRGK